MSPRPPSHPPSVPKNRAGGRGKRAKVTTKISQSPEAAQPRCLRRTERMRPPCPGERLPEGFGAAPGAFRAGFASPKGFEGHPNPSRVIHSRFRGCQERDAVLEDAAGSRISESQNKMGWKGFSKATQSNPSAISRDTNQIRMQPLEMPKKGCSPWECQERDAGSRMFGEGS